MTRETDIGMRKHEKGDEQDDDDDDEVPWKLGLLRNQKKEICRIENTKGTLQAALSSSSSLFPRFRRH